MPGLPAMRGLKSRSVVFSDYFVAVLPRPAVAGWRIVALGPRMSLDNVERVRNAQQIPLEPVKQVGESERRYFRDDVSAKVPPLDAPEPVGLLADLRNLSCVDILGHFEMDHGKLEDRETQVGCKLRLRNRHVPDSANSFAGGACTNCGHPAGFLGAQTSPEHEAHA